MAKERYKTHPACAAWPDASEERFERLVENIREDGFAPERPVLLYRDDSGCEWLLDGRKRLAAAKIAKERGPREGVSVEPIYAYFTPKSEWPGEIDGEIYLRIKSLNSETYDEATCKRIDQEWASQKKIELKYRRVMSTGRIVTTNRGAVQQAEAEAEGVSVRQVQRKEWVNKNALPETKKLHDEGKITTGGAEKLCKLEKAAQHFACLKIHEGMDITAAIKAAKADEAERNKPPVTDSAGRVVPDVYKKLFEEAEEFMAISRTIADVRNRLRALCDSDTNAGAELLDYMSGENGFDRRLQSMAETIRGSKPYAVCVSCRGRKVINGKACTDCRSRGWMIELQYNQAPPEKRAG